MRVNFEADLVLCVYRDRSDYARGVGRRGRGVVEGMDYGSMQAFNSFRGSLVYMHG